MSQRILLINLFTLGVVLFGLVALVPALALAQGTPDRPYRVYLPSLVKAPRQSVFGLEMFRIEPDRGLGMAAATNVQWVRRNGLHWKAVEPEEGQGYHWDAPVVRQLEQELINAGKHNLNVILVIRSSPHWAVAPHRADCAPVNPAKVGAYARFVAAAVERYSKPPFNVRYWEIGNEPDAYVFDSHSPFGCWGIKDDPYYGGEAYGRALLAVSEAVKRVNPTVKVLNGGLMLDRPYDPADPASRSGRFFEGMLRAGAGSAFDILSFHTYVYYRTPGQDPLGPREDWRVDYLRGMLRQYGVGEKPLLRTEAALLCPVLTSECSWAQADFVARLFARSMRDRLAGSIWFIYDNDSFHSSALVDPGNTFAPRPVYFAYRHAALRLGGSRYLGPIAGLPAAAEGYRFALDETTIYVLWADQPRSVQIELPSGARLECYDRDGGSFACTAERGRLALTVNSHPIFVVARAP